MADPIIYGLRKKGETRIIGSIPVKVHERPPTSAEFIAQYEEVPLYGEEAITALQSELRDVRERLARVGALVEKLEADRGWTDTIDAVDELRAILDGEAK